MYYKFCHVTCRKAWQFVLALHISPLTKLKSDQQKLLHPCFCAIVYCLCACTSPHWRLKSVELQLLQPFASRLEMIVCCIKFRLISSRFRKKIIIIIIIKDSTLLNVGQNVYYFPIIWYFCKLFHIIIFLIHNSHKNK